jgi:PE family
MSFVIAAPEYVAAAATDLANIGSWISSANAAALGPTSGVLAAGADEVSAAVAALFSSHAQTYQALSAAAQMFHTQFVELMNGGAEQYALAEAANATPLQAAGQSVMSGGSAAAGIPAGLAGSSTPAAATAPMAAAVSTVPPVSAAPAPLAPAGVPVASSGSAAALTPPGLPAAALPAATPAYAAATAEPPLPAPVGAPAAEVQEATEFSPATATPAPPAPVAAAPAASSAHSPATPPPREQGATTAE